MSSTRIYARLFRIGLQDAIQYRIEGVIWFLFDVLPPIMMLFFWSVAYNTSDSIAGYRQSEMLAYTLGVLVLRNLVTVHTEWEIENDVRQGQLSAHLIRPLSPWVLWFFSQLGWRVWRTLMVSPILLVAAVILGPALELPRLHGPELAGFIASLFLAYVVCFFFKLIVGFTAFWLTNIQAVISLTDVAVYLFGGMLIPLELLPDVMRSIAILFPQQWIFAFPLSIMLGRSEGGAMLQGLGAQVLWIGILSLVAAALWRAGLRRYEAVGG